MMKNVRMRLSLTAVVVALAVWAFYPPDKKINLGLDLKGGILAPPGLVEFACHAMFFPKRANCEKEVEQSGEDR